MSPRGVSAVFTMPSWVGPVGAWCGLPNSTFTSSGAGWTGTSPGGGTYTNVVTAWSGGVLNTVGIWRAGSFVPGKFLVLFGGGHGDYAGNELYAYGPLDSDSPTFSRILDPTVPGPDDVARVGGYPVSRHTYNQLSYVHSLNRMICSGAAGVFHTGNGFNVVDAFDFNLNPALGTPWTNYDSGFRDFAAGGTGGIDVQSDYNPITHKIWAMGKGNGTYLQCLDLATGAWTNTAKNNPDGQTDCKGCIVPPHNLMVWRSNDGAIKVQDLASPSSAIYAPTVTDSAPATGDCTMEWDAVGNRIVYWDGAGATVHFLTPGANPASGGDPWVWSSVTPGGTTPAVATTNGTYGRMRMVSFPWGRGLLLMSKHDAPINFLRMS